MVTRPVGDGVLDVPQIRSHLTVPHNPVGDGVLDVPSVRLSPYGKTVAETLQEIEEAGIDCGALRWYNHSDKSLFGIQIPLLYEKGP